MDLFGGKNTPPADPSERYTSSKTRDEQSSAINKTQVSAEEQAKFTVEQIVGSPQEGEIVEDQTNIIKNTTSFLEIPRKETTVSLKEVEEEAKYKY